MAGILSDAHPIQLVDSSVGASIRHPQCSEPSSHAAGRQSKQPHWRASGEALVVGVFDLSHFLPQIDHRGGKFKLSQTLLPTSTRYWPSPRPSTAPAKWMVWEAVGSLSIHLIPKHDLSTLRRHQTLPGDGATMSRIIKGLQHLREPLELSVVSGYPQVLENTCRLISAIRRLKLVGRRATPVDSRPGLLRPVPPIALDILPSLSIFKILFLQVLKCQES